MSVREGAISDEPLFPHIHAAAVSVHLNTDLCSSVTPYLILDGYFVDEMFSLIIWMLALCLSSGTADLCNWTGR